MMLNGILPSELPLWESTTSDGTNGVNIVAKDSLEMIVLALDTLVSITVEFTILPENITQSMEEWSEYRPETK